MRYVFDKTKNQVTITADNRNYEVDVEEIIRVKGIVNMVFGCTKKHNKVSYWDRYHKFGETCGFGIDQVSFGSQKEAAYV